MASFALQLLKTTYQPPINTYLQRDSFFIPTRSSLKFHVPLSKRIAPLKSGRYGASGLVASLADITLGNEKKNRYPGEEKGFVDEMRIVAMKMHTPEQMRAVQKCGPSVDGILRFLVDNKVVHDALEEIVDRDAYTFHSEFKNTGLERSKNLAKDLEWFKEQGYNIPQPSSIAISYAEYLKEMKNPQAFICHFYNVYFGHSAGGRLIGKVSGKVLNGKELEFYKWDGEVSHLLQNVRDNLNKIAEEWSREEKKHCLEETKNSFKHMGEIIRHVLP